MGSCRPAGACVLFVIPYRGLTPPAKYQRPFGADSQVSPSACPSMRQLGIRSIPRRPHRGPIVCWPSHKRWTTGTPAAPLGLVPPLPYHTGRDELGSRRDCHSESRLVGMKNLAPFAGQRHHADKRSRADAAGFFASLRMTCERPETFAQSQGVRTGGL